MTNGKVILASGIKLDKSYTNVLSYGTNQMLELVEANQEYNQSNYNCIDYTKNEIKVSCDYNTAIGCNYLAFQNPIHGNKWYFAFIDDVQFKSEGCSIVKFTLDVWSTFYDDWQRSPCFVVREHVNDDTVGANTVPENVTLGDYVIQAHLRDSYNRYYNSAQQGQKNQRVVVSSNIEPSEASKVFGGIYHGIPTGYRYYSYDIDNVNGYRSHIELAQAHEGEINQLFLAPKWLAGDVTFVADSLIPEVRELGISPITQLDGYTPVNKKLLTYPYCFIKSSNGQGQEAILHQELWKLSNGEYKQEMIGCLTAGCSIRLIPKNYNGDELCFEEGINLRKIPSTKLGF